jgi:hypothetical protein
LPRYWRKNEPFWYRELYNSSTVQIPYNLSFFLDTLKQ